MNNIYNGRGEGRCGMKKLLIILPLIALFTISGWLWQSQLHTRIASESPTKPSITIPTPKKILGETIQKKQPEDLPPMCNMTKQEVMLDAFNFGIKDANELKKLSATYDLLCFGETDIDIPEESPQSQYIVEERSPITLTKPTPMQQVESFAEKWEKEQQQKCQEDINEYNTCLSEYSAKMTEYNSCLVEHDDAMFSPCSKPYSYCSKPACL